MNNVYFTLSKVVAIFFLFYGAIISAQNKIDSSISIEKNSVPYNVSVSNAKPKHEVSVLTVSTKSRIALGANRTPDLKTLRPTEAPAKKQANSDQYLTKARSADVINRD